MFTITLRFDSDNEYTVSDLVDTIKGIAPYMVDNVEIDLTDGENGDRPTQCVGLSGECPNTPLEDGYCIVHDHRSA